MLFSQHAFTFFWFSFVWFLRQGLAIYPWSFCLSLSSSGITGVSYHPQLCIHFFDSILLFILLCVPLILFLSAPSLKSHSFVKALRKSSDPSNENYHFLVFFWCLHCTFILLLLGACISPSTSPPHTVLGSELKALCLLGRLEPFFFFSPLPKTIILLPMPPAQLELEVCTNRPSLLVCNEAWLTFCLGWPQTAIIPISASWISEIIGMNYVTWHSKFLKFLKIWILFVNIASTLPSSACTLQGFNKYL
jgi:hypothetical protein